MLLLKEHAVVTIPLLPLLGRFFFPFVLHLFYALLSSFQTITGANLLKMA